ncbi:MAG: hypothetical protein ACRELY_13395 [Polyangiaceae bacterium]
MKNLALLSLAAAALLSGCTVRATSSGSGSSGPMSTAPTTLHSSSYDVSQLRASMSAQAGDSTVKVYAALFADDANANNVAVVLDSGDFFTVQAGTGDAVVLVHEPAEDPTDVHYTATLPEASSAQDLVIAFHRAAGRRDAPSTLIHLPDPFQIESTPPVSVKKGTSLDVQVSRDLGSMAELEVSGKCLDPDQNPASWIVLDYNDSITIDTSGLVYQQGETTGCDVSFYLSEVTDGSLDPNFLGGVSGWLDVEGIQKRGFDTTVVP